MQEPESPMGRACTRRYSAWTLYARAFAGNRADAEDLVRRAVNRTLQCSDDLVNERQAHDRVLGAIRTEALGLLSRRKGRGGDDDQPPEPSVLHLLTDEASMTDPRHAAEVASQVLQELPRAQRRALQMLLLRRPALPLRDLARRRHVDLAQMSEEIEEGLDHLAGALRAVSEPRYQGGHPELKDLTGYVDGALTGEEARAIIAHCDDCSGCGDRLGTMMLLRSGSAKAALAPRVSRGTKAAALVLTLAVGLVGGVFLARAMAPNPWAEVATADSVPRWFHDFLYGYRDDIDSRDIALAESLDLLVRGEYADVIAKLAPLLEEPAREPEAAAYAGIALYLMGDTSQRTLGFLENGINSSRAGRISDWYLANILLARGDIGRARARLSGLAFVGDCVGRQSQGLLDRLDELERGAPAIIG